MKSVLFTRLRAILLVVLSVIITFTMISLPGTYVDAYNTVKYDDPETKLTFKLTEDTKKASLYDIDDSLSHVKVPSTVTKDGTTYTVTSVDTGEI